MDLRIEGPDANVAGLRYDRSYDPLALYDRRDPDAAATHFAAFAKEHGFDARAVALPSPVPHAERARRALEARSAGAGGVVYDGLWGAVVAAPHEGPFDVVGVPMPKGEFEGRFRSIDVLVQPGVEPASSHLAGRVMVDHGQFLCVDLDVLEHDFRARIPLDGLADYVFWGADAEALAVEHGASRLDDGCFGWRDVADEDVGAFAGPLQAAIDERALRVAVDYRPHCHAEAINRQVRARRSRAGEIELAGQPVCGFDNRWGDGLFTVVRDLDAEGRLVRIRIDVGDDKSQRIMRRVAHRHQSVIVSRAVLDDGEPARFVDREVPSRPSDSGWIVSAGVESDDASAFVAIPVTELVARYPELQPLLDEEVGAQFTLQEDGSYRRGK